MPFTLRQALGAVALLLIIGLSGYALVSYGFQQHRVGLEGRNLHSSQAVLVDIAPAEAVSLVKALGGDARAFVDLDDSGTVRAVAAAHLDRFDYPSPGRRAGAPMTEGTALAGSAITDVAEPQPELVRFASRSYPIVGWLGLEERSLLSHTMVIADEELFAAAAEGAVVFDGTDIAARLAAQAPHLTTRPVAAGATGRTNIDEMSPTLMLLGVVTLVVAAGLCGAVLAAMGRAWLEHMYLLGGDPLWLRVKAYGCILVSWGLALVAGAPVVWPLPARDWLQGWLYVMIAVLAMVTVTFWGSFLRRSGR